MKRVCNQVIVIVDLAPGYMLNYYCWMKKTRKMLEFCFYSIECGEFKGGNIVNKNICAIKSRDIYLMKVSFHSSGIVE